MFANVENSCSVITLPSVSREIVMPLCTYRSCILDHNNNSSSDSNSSGNSQGGSNNANYNYQAMAAPNTQLLLLVFSPMEATVPNVPSVPAFSPNGNSVVPYSYQLHHRHYQSLNNNNNGMNELSPPSGQSDLAKGTHAKDRSTFPLPLLHTSFTANGQYDLKDYSNVLSSDRLLNSEIKIQTQTQTQAQTQTQIEIQKPSLPFIADNKYCPCSSPSLSTAKSLKNRHQYSIRGQVAQKLQHVKPLLNTNKPWKCPDCCKSYTTMDGLHSHFRVHTEWCFKCNECGHRFARSRDLQEHVRVHTNERPYPCQYCRKAFKQRHNLKDHERIHTRRDLFLCEICGKAFVAKHNMRNHRKSHLSNANQSTPIE